LLYQTENKNGISMFQHSYDLTALNDDRKFEVTTDTKNLCFMVDFKHTPIGMGSTHDAASMMQVLAGVLYGGKITITYDDGGAVRAFPIIQNRSLSHVAKVLAGCSDNGQIVFELREVDGDYNVYRAHFKIPIGWDGTIRLTGTQKLVCEFESFRNASFLVGSTTYHNDAIITVTNDVSENAGTTFVVVENMSTPTGNTVNFSLAGVSFLSVPSDATSKLNLYGTGGTHADWDNTSLANFAHCNLKPRLRAFGYVDTYCNFITMPVILHSNGNIVNSDASVYGDIYMVSPKQP
jgi:hypothetical protein